MKTLFGTCAAFALATLLMPEVASAEAPPINGRCVTDSLDPNQAQQRLNWARRCGLSMNVQPFGVVAFDTGIPAANGGTLLDYEEHQVFAGSGANNFADISQNFEVNSAYVNALYLSGATSQVMDAWGFYQWSRASSRRKARPLYPSFGDTPNLSTSTQLFPSPNPQGQDCRLFYDMAGTRPVPAGTYFYVNAMCESSCYTPEQKVLFSDGYSPILDAVNARREDMVTLTPDSSLDSIKLMTGRTSSYTAEIRDASHPIVELKMASGALLRVTVEHPVVTAEGRLVTAQTLHEGDELLKADGTPERIAAINRTTYFGKVYNLRPATTDRVSNLLIAEGYVMGSSLFQNDEVGYMNRIILHYVPAEHIP